MLEYTVSIILRKEQTFNTLRITPHPQKGERSETDILQIKMRVKMPH